MHMSERTITTTEAESKPKREKLHHVQFDIQYHSKGKMRAFRKEFGNDGLVAYMDLQLTLADSTDAEMRLDQAISLTKEWMANADLVIPMLEYLAERQMLLKYERDGISWISHPRIAIAQENLFAERKKWREKKKGKKGDSPEIPRRRKRDSRSLDQPLDQTQDQDLDQTKIKKEIAPKVFLSESDLSQLLTHMTDAELKYWINQCADAGKSKPRKWATYKDHAATIRSWRSMKIEAGKKWSEDKNQYEIPRRFPGDSFPTTAQRNQEATHDAVRSIFEKERERGAI